MSSAYFGSWQVIWWDALEVRRRGSSLTIRVERPVFETCGRYPPLSPRWPDTPIYHWTARFAYLEVRRLAR